MEFVGNIVDLGAPTFHVTCICKADMISPNVIQFSYSKPHVLADGSVENIVEVHVTWDVASLPSVSESFKVAMVEFFGAPHEKHFLKARPLNH